MYGGAAGLSIRQTTNIDAGDTANTCHWDFPNHIGTHIDAPHHFFNGAPCITDYPPEFWYFQHPRLVDIEAEDGYLIVPKDVENHLHSETDLLLLRTGYERYRSEDRYWQRNPGLSAELGLWLRREYPAVKMVGLDCISVTSRLHREEGRSAHQAFLDPDGKGHPVLLIEDMALAGTPGQLRQVIVAPLRVSKADGGPCTVVGLK